MEKGNETNCAFKVVVAKARDETTSSSFQGPGRGIRTRDRESSSDTSFDAV